MCRYYQLLSTYNLAPKNAFLPSGYHHLVFSPLDWTCCSRRRRNPLDSNVHTSKMELERGHICQRNDSIAKKKKKKIRRWVSSPPVLDWCLDKDVSEDGCDDDRGWRRRRRTSPPKLSCSNRQGNERSLKWEHSQTPDLSLLQPPTLSHDAVPEWRRDRAGGSQTEKETES